MTEQRFFELLGRKQATLEEVQANYALALDLVAKILTGEIDTSRVIVNLTDQTFQWVAPGNSPSLPATINGLPNCVVDPEPKTKAELVREIEVLTERVKALESTPSVPTV
jgi:hypothetical protein